MQERTAFTNKCCVRANRIPAVHSPQIPPLAKSGRRDSGEALNAFERTHSPCGRLWEMRLAKVALFFLFVVLTLSVQGGVREGGAVWVTGAALDRGLLFFP